MMINKIDESLKKNAVHPDPAPAPYKGMKPIDEQELDRNSNGMLGHMNRSGYNMYLGSIPPDEVKRRRYKNKKQKQARRVNRKHK